MRQKTKFPSSPVMIVDDEKHILIAFETELRGAGITNTITVNDSRQVMALVSEHEVSIVMLDLSMPYLNGNELLEHLVQDFPEVPVIVVTGTDEVDTAVRCMKTGAFDNLVKPVEEGLLPATIRRAIRFRELNTEVRGLQNRLFDHKIEHPEVFRAIVTDCDKMRIIFQYAELVAKTSNPILITGETGVGKELISRPIHKLSDRLGDFISINVAGLDDNVFSDTLFGHRKGAFTGADEGRKGIIEQAAGGTLVLDEIGDLSPGSQVKLLRLLQEGEYLPLGEDKTKHSDVRIIAVTNHDLQEKQNRGQFRKDLYYRLQTHHIHVPPLRERMADLPSLVDHFLQKASRKLDIKTPVIPKELFDILGAYDFPGNIRELEAMISDAVSVHRGGILSTTSFRAYIGKSIRIPQGTMVTQNNDSANPFSVWDKLPTLKEADRLIMVEALHRTNNNMSVAAQILGISRQALGKRMQRRRDQ